MERAMSDQEMQFADPDWKPTRPLDKNKAPQEQEVYNPRPINAENQEQRRQQTPTSLPDYQEGYAGPGAKLPPPGQTEYPFPGSYGGTAPQGIGPAPFRQQQARRRGRSPWLWIIIAIIIIGFMSGGFGSAFGGRSSPFRDFGPQNSVTETRAFPLSNNQPTIIINDASGNIEVHSGSSSGGVTVQTIKQADGFGNPKDEQVSYTPGPGGNSLTIDFAGGNGSVDFNVTVPDNSNLNLQTNSGDITVDGINGQISMSTRSGDITATNDTFSGSAKLTTDSGAITAKQDQLNGPTTLSTGSGDITFDGAINSSGNYQFTTSSGNIDATLSGNTGLEVNASTENGTVTSGVSTVSVQNSDSGDTANGYIGSPNSSTQLILKTSDGSINLNSQQ